MGPEQKQTSTLAGTIDALNSAICVTESILNGAPLEEVENSTPACNIINAARNRVENLLERIEKVNVQLRELG